MKPQSAGIGRVLQNRRHHLLPPSLGRGSAREVGAVSFLVSRYQVSWAAYQAGWDPVPCWSMVCMKMARRRASASRALRMFDLCAIVTAQAFSFGVPL